MGEVYRARDTKVLASLNHPHIAGIYASRRAESKCWPPTPTTCSARPALDTRRPIGGRIGRPLVTSDERSISFITEGQTWVAPFATSSRIERQHLDAEMSRIAAVNAHGGRQCQRLFTPVAGMRKAPGIPVSTPPDLLISCQLVKFQGEFVWHHHDAEDELFLVIEGRFRMDFRDRQVWLERGEFLIVPRGVEHRPVAHEEVSVLLFEPAGTVNTGNVAEARTWAIVERI